MGDVIKDIRKNITMPIARTFDDKQKKLRKGVVRLIDVEEEDRKNPNRTQLEDKSEAFEKEEDLYVLDSLRHWDVTMPPTKKKKFGFMVPGIKSTLSKTGLGRVVDKKRRVTIELYKKMTPAEAERDKEKKRRVFQKLYQRASMVDVGPLDVNEDGVPRLADEPALEDDDLLLVRLLREKKSGGFHGYLDWDDDDSHSTASRQRANGHLESHTLTTYNVEDYGDGQENSNLSSSWKERHRSRLSTVEVIHIESQMVEIKLGIKEKVQQRKLCFETPHEMETFVSTFEKMKELIKERGDRMAAKQRMNMGKPKVSKEPSKRADKDPRHATSWFSSFGTIEEPINEEVNLLIEIVSASDLPIADISSSDPYVCVEDGRQRWHKTGVLSSTLHPVWTLSTGSMFLIQTNLTDFFASASRIEFVVKDYDTVGANEILGSCLVKKQDLLEGDGERVEYQLNTARYAEESKFVLPKKKSYLTLRFKKATEDEIKFLRSYEAKKETGVLSTLGLASGGPTGVFADDCYLPPRTHPSTVWKKNERKADDGIAVKYRIKPFPDPSRPIAETKWLSEKQIQAEVKKPSRDWIEAGSGNVGKFYLEILGCDGLPNLDMSVSGRNKSDPFVCICYEDCVVNTDVINDCLAPRWMPWTQRAFVFNVMHPSSQFYIAVMDHEEVKGQHDKIGRCIVNPTNLRPNIMYSMRYNLVNSDEVNRKTRGKIFFRIRFESPTERQYLLSTLQFRTNYYVSTNAYADSNTMSVALTNDKDRYVLSLETITKYLDELFEYQLYIDDIVNALEAVILWRGHFPLTIPFFHTSYTLMMPFHSMTAFTWAILLSQDFDRFGSFICFSFAWVLFAMLEVQRSNPNPWKRPRTYIDLLGTLVFNKSFAVHKIDENQNIEAIMTFDERRNDLMKFRKDTMLATQARYEQEEMQMQKEDKEINKQSRDKRLALAMGPTRLFLAPFEEILVPVQQILYQACIYCRCAKSIIVWNDSIVAFWVATVALLLTGITFFVPWTFLFRWTFRILSISLLGPWMKLVDIFYMDDDTKMTYEERKAKVEAEMQLRYEYLMGESKLRRTIKERTLKKRDMERYMFGQYGVRVPIYKEERFASVPLVGGCAYPYDPSKRPPPNIVRRINGQFLTGNMIMKRQNPAKEFKAQKNFQDSEIPAVISTEFDDEKAPLLKGDKGYGATEV